MWSFLADQFDQVGPCKLSQPCIGNGLSGHGPVDLDQHLDRVFANVRSLLEDRLPFRQEPAPHGQQIDRSGQQGRQPDSKRSEEHTSELQSLMRISYAVFCLKKKKT